MNQISNFKIGDRVVLNARFLNNPKDEYQQFVSKYGFTNKTVGVIASSPMYSNYRVRFPDMPKYSYSARDLSHADIRKDKNHPLTSIFK